MPFSPLLTEWLDKISINVARSLDRRPWNEIETDERMRHVPELLQALLRHSAWPDEQGDALPPEVMTAACGHGRHRATLGLDEWVLLEEYYLFRRETFASLRAHLRPIHLDPFLARFDRAVSRATLAGLRCMHGLDPQGV